MMSADVSGGRDWTVKFADSRARTFLSAEELLSWIGIAEEELRLAPVVMLSDLSLDCLSSKHPFLVISPPNLAVTVLTQ